MYVFVCVCESAVLPLYDVCLHVCLNHRGDEGGARVELDSGVEIAERTTRRSGWSGCSEGSMLFGIFVAMSMREACHV